MGIILQNKTRCGARKMKKQKKWWMSVTNTVKIEKKEGEFISTSPSSSRRTYLTFTHMHTNTSSSTLRTGVIDKDKMQTTHTETAKQLGWTGLDLDWIDDSIIITLLHAFVANRKKTHNRARTPPDFYTLTQTQTTTTSPLAAIIIIETNVNHPLNPLVFSALSLCVVCQQTLNIR